MSENLKFTVTYVRRVQTAPFENMVVGLEMEFPRNYTRDQAFKEVRDMVERWVDEQLNPKKKGSR